MVVILCDVNFIINVILTFLFFIYCVYIYPVFLWGGDNLFLRYHFGQLCILWDSVFIDRAVSPFLWRFILDLFSNYFIEAAHLCILSDKIWCITKMRLLVDHCWRILNRAQFQRIFVFRGHDDRIEGVFIIIIGLILFRFWLFRKFFLGSFHRQWCFLHLLGYLDRIWLLWEDLWRLLVNFLYLLLIFIQRIVFGNFDLIF